MASAKNYYLSYNSIFNRDNKTYIQIHIKMAQRPAIFWHDHACSLKKIIHLRPVKWAEQDLERLFTKECLLIFSNLIKRYRRKHGGAVVSTETQQQAGNGFEHNITAAFLCGLLRCPPVWVSSAVSSHSPRTFYFTRIPSNTPYIFSVRLCSLTLDIFYQKLIKPFFTMGFNNSSPSNLSEHISFNWHKINRKKQLT